jgi:hypothetical protein
VYYLSWLFLTDRLESGIELFIKEIITFPNFESLPILMTTWFAYHGFFLVLITFSLLDIIADKLISLRRRAWVIFDLTFVTLLAMLLTGFNLNEQNYLFVIPFSFFLTGSLLMQRRPLLTEILCILSVLLLVVLRVYPLI